MSAPKGNRFWEARSSHGRRPRFSDPEVLWDACTQYFEWVEENPLWEMKPFAFQGVVTQEPVAKMRAMTIGGLCIFLDIDQTTWADYRSKEDFSRVTSRVEAIIRDQKFSGAAADLLNPNIIARDLGLAERNELTGKGGGAIQVTSKHDLTDDQLLAIATGGSAGAADSTPGA